MAHYYARHFFADLLLSSITNGSNIDVYTITDSISDVIGVYLVIKLWNWNSPPGECLHEWRIVTDVVNIGGNFRLFSPISMAGSL